MGQLNTVLQNMRQQEIRVPFDENDGNGLVIEGKYIPEELLSQILSHVDYKSLCQCQLVCKRWNQLIQNYVWRKKAEMILECAFPVDSDTPWIIYYFLCTKKIFNRNLIKSHSGEKKFYKWTLLNNSYGWEIENPPVGAPPLPKDTILEGTNHCFVTFDSGSAKCQTINLFAEGFTKYILDIIQPPIHVSEWYIYQRNRPATYSCKVELIEKKPGIGDLVIDHCSFSKVLKSGDENKWFKFEYKFKNYGKGLRKIKFYHAGSGGYRDGLIHYSGAKMAGACVRFDLPDFKKIDMEALTRDRECEA